MHGLLLALMVLAFPHGWDTSKGYGWSVRVAQRRVETALTNHAPAAMVLKRACPILYPVPEIALDQFRLLKAARYGVFAGFVETEGVAIKPGREDAVRR
jgi:hypothetical protein